MKHVIAKLAATFTRMKVLIGRMYDPYVKAVDDLRGTPAYAYLFRPYAGTPC